MAAEYYKGYCAATDDILSKFNAIDYEHMTVKELKNQLYHMIMELKPYNK